MNVIARIALYGILATLPAMRPGYAGETRSVAAKGQPSQVSVLLAYSSLMRQKQRYSYVRAGKSYEFRADCGSGPFSEAFVYCGGGRVNSSAIENLLTALDQPPMGPPDAAALGLTPSWLASHASELARRHKRGFMEDRA